MYSVVLKRTDWLRRRRRVVAAAEAGAWSSGWEEGGRCLQFNKGDVGAAEFRSILIYFQLVTAIYTIPIDSAFLWMEGGGGGLGYTEFTLQLYYTIILLFKINKFSALPIAVYCSSTLKTIRINHFISIYIT